MAAGAELVVAHRTGALGAGWLAVVQADLGPLASGRRGRIGRGPPASAWPGAVCLPGLFDSGGSLYVHRHARTSVGPGLGTGAVTAALARRRRCGNARRIGNRQYVADALLARQRVII